MTFFLFSSENTQNISSSSSISSLKSIIAAAKTFFFANIANESGEVENSLFPIVVYILNVANHDSQQRATSTTLVIPRPARSNLVLVVVLGVGSKGP